MKLITHNMLRCNVKNVVNGYPLRIEASKVELRESEMNEEFLRNMVSRLDWNALRGAVSQVLKSSNDALPTVELPKEVRSELDLTDTDLKNLHTALVELVVVEGKLVCPESGRIFPINNSIPNMLLNEDEV